MHVDSTQLAIACLLLLSAIAGGTLTAAQIIPEDAKTFAATAPAITSTPTAVIFELSDEGQQYAASAKFVSASSLDPQPTVSPPPSAAVAAAASFGASYERQQQISQLVASAADAAPGIAAVASSLAGQANEAGIAVVNQAELTSVFQGAVLTAGSGNDALKLLRQLEKSRLVKYVWLAGTRQLLQPVHNTDIRPQNTPDDLPDNNGAAAAAAVSSTSSPVTVDDLATPGKQAGIIIGGSSGISSSRGGSITPEAAAAAAAVGPAGGAAATSFKSMGLKQLQREVGGLDGRAVLVCIVDSGINYRLPEYGNCTRINNPPGTCKVVTGYDFVGDRYDGRTAGPGPVQGSEPVDCNGKFGHGTMVGSVVSTSNGLAKGSKLGSYRVFGCNGTTTDDIIIRAVDRAIQDGCDVINLSLAGEAGYPDSGLYKTVMAKANQLGVLVVKAAGNNGDDGPFRADAATVVGAVSVGSVGDMFTSVDEYMTVSSFSSYGPPPDLSLGPHVCAPGYYVKVVDRRGGRRYNSGTSFSAPYVAAVLALWLQYQQQQAAASGKTLERTSVNQQAALRGLVATAGPVRDVFKPEFLEPIARCGGGYLQADAFILNQARLNPMMIQLPSQITISHLSKVTVTWDGPAHPDGIVTYDISHQPAVSITLGDGWYGTEAAVQKRFVSAAVTFDKASVTLNTTASRRSARFQVTFSLPDELTAQPLLYSGRILLTPRTAAMAISLQNSSAAATGGSARLVPVSIPYQGFSGPYDKTLRLMARSLSSLNQRAAAALERYQDMLCYAPRSRPYYPNAILDSGEVSVPKVCSGGYTVSNNVTLSVSLQVLRQSPECSLRIVLAPQVPIRTLTVQLLNSRGALLGSMWPLDTAPADSLGLARQVASYCLRFNGSYVATSSSSSSSSAGRQMELQPGSIYRLKAVCEGPVAAADAKLGLKPATSLVSIRGRFRVTA